MKGGKNLKKTIWFVVVVVVLLMGTLTGCMVKQGNSLTIKHRVAEQTLQAITAQTTITPPKTVKNDGLTQYHICPAMGGAIPTYVEFYVDSMAVEGKEVLSQAKSKDFTWVLTLNPQGDKNEILGTAKTIEYQDSPGRSKIIVNYEDSENIFPNQQKTLNIIFYQNIAIHRYKSMPTWTLGFYFRENGEVVQTDDLGKALVYFDVDSGQLQAKYGIGKLNVEEESWNHFAALEQIQEGECSFDFSASIDGDVYVIQCETGYAKMMIYAMYTTVKPNEEIMNGFYALVEYSLSGEFLSFGF